MSNSNPSCLGHSGGCDAGSVQVHEWVPCVPGGGGHLLCQGPRYLPAPGALIANFNMSQGNSGVSSGVVYIESGPKIDQKALFDRKDCTIFGWSLDTTDLQYVLELNEPCFVKLEPLPECEVDCEVQTRVVSLWIGWPKEYASYTHPNQVSSLKFSDKPDNLQVPVGDRHKLLLYLEAHNLSIKDFLNVIKGERVPRIFIPFRRDEMKGTVVQLDRGSKSRGVGLKEQRQGRDAGAVSGVIKVDKGPIIGALVTFHRRWPLLTHLKMSNPGTLGCWVTTWGRPT